MLPRTTDTQKMRRSVAVTWRLEEEEQGKEEEEVVEEDGCVVETQRFCPVFAVCTFLELRD